MSKRSMQSNGSHGRPRKRPRSIDGALRETASIEERAEPFRLMTVRFPVDDVTPTWSTGRNREINEKHVQQLCRLFNEYGLGRLNREHRLRLLCSARDVQMMCENTGIDCRPNDSGDLLTSFTGWRRAVTGTAEVLAGNHRIAALKAYLVQQKLADDDDERWWACDIFDRDTLPLKLQIELRANRGGTVLPDTHGQIWAELCTYAEQDENGRMFNGARGDIEALMSQALKLNTREQFPVRRLAILWKNDRWRAFVTRLCGRRAGRDLLNISTFQKLSSFRIDDYLFDRIESVMRPIDVIWEDLGIELELERDYARLAGLYRRWEPQELFYPRHRGKLENHEDSPRHPQFLLSVDNSKYHALYRYLVNDGRELSFPNAQELLRNLNSYGKTMQAVMTHVVMWLNDDLVTVNARGGNKPPLVEELTSVVSSMLEVAVRGGPSPETKAKMLELQRTVLAYVEKNAAAFTRDDLSLLPEAGVEPKTYQDRFRLDIWRDVFARVRELVGPRFRNPCVSGLDMVAMAQPLPTPNLGVTDVLQSVISQHPEIVGNPTLNRPEAKEALEAMIERTLTQWKQRYGQQRTETTPRDGELAPTALIPELARSRGASASETPLIDEEDRCQRGKGAARDSASTHGKEAKRKRAKASLFVESSESEEQSESHDASERRVYSLSPDVERDGPLRSIQSSNRAQGSNARRSFNTHEEQIAREASSSRDISLARTFTQKVHRIQHAEVASESGSGGTRQPACKPGSAVKSNRPFKPHAKPQSGSGRPPAAARPQQKHGWRTQPFAGA